MSDDTRLTRLDAELARLHEETRRLRSELLTLRLAAMIALALVIAVPPGASVLAWTALGVVILGLVRGVLHLLDGRLRVGRPALHAWSRPAPGAREG
jgi:hypothetical protein